MKTLEFIITKEFDRAWKEMGLTDKELSGLQVFLCENPDAGDVIEGTAGVRKLRWALEGRGKSGGTRIIYLNIVFSEHIYLITAFPKNKKENLSKQERNAIKSIVISIKNAEKEAKYGKK
jgi:hypothetical protein